MFSDSTVVYYIRTNEIWNSLQSMSSGKTLGLAWILNSNFLPEDQSTCILFLKIVKRRTYKINQLKALFIQKLRVQPSRCPVYLFIRFFTIILIARYDYIWNSGLYGIVALFYVECKPIFDFIWMCRYYTILSWDFLFVSFLINLEIRYQSFLYSG